MSEIQLSELRQLHKHLDEEIADAMGHRSIDGLVIVDLKRQRLRVKDAIEYLRHQGTRH